jgi:hypothetical protein
MNAAEMSVSSNRMLTLRQEPLLELEEFCRALRKALNLDRLRPGELLDALRVGSTAECTECGFHLTGEELLELSDPASPVESSSSDFGRLRLGHCARKDCDSFYYRLTFQCMPQLDWRKLLPRIDAIRVELAREPIHRLNPLEVLQRPIRNRRFRGVRRILAALALGAFVVALWQAYHYAGTPGEPAGLRTDPLQEDAAPAQ